MEKTTRLRALLFVAGFAVLTAVSGSVSAEKITIDPNGPGSSRQAPCARISPDAPLARKVTYEATSRRVVDILQDLSGAYGVDLRAGYSQFDWQVRDRRMNIFARDVPLHKLMDSIARVMKFKWSSGAARNGRKIYRLYMDRRSLLDEEARRAREAERLARLEAERRRQSLELFYGLADLSTEDAASIREENPYEYFLVKSGIARSVGAFLRETPAVVDALANGDLLSLTANSLSPEARARMLAVVGDLERVEFPGPGSGRTVPSEVPDDAQDVVIRVNDDLSDLKASMQEAPCVLGLVELEIGGFSTDITLLDPESDFAKAVGEVLLASQEEARPPSEVGEMMRDKILQALASDVSKEVADDPPAKHPNDSDLLADVAIHPKSNELPDVQSALAQASGFSVVSDCFTRTSGALAVTDQDSELGDLLDAIGKAYRYDWDKRGEIVEFRDQRWFAKRAAQIPEEWLEKWRGKLTDTGTLDLGDLVQMAALTEEQFSENIVADSILGKPAITVPLFTARGILRLYGSLSVSQRSSVFSRDGLDLDSLTRDQWLLLQRVVNARNASFLQRNSECLNVSAARTRHGNMAGYTFTISSNRDTEQLVWTFDAPEYRQTPDAEID